MSKFEDSIELAIPFKSLSFPVDYKNVEFVVTVVENSQELKRLPYQSSIVLPKPDETFDFLN